MEAPWVRSCSKVAINFQQQPPRLVRWGFHLSPIGYLMIGIVDDSTICRIDFAGGRKAPTILKAWQESWPKTNFLADQSQTRTIVTLLEGKASPRSLVVHMMGTPFQQAVWKQIAQIPAGQTRSYGEIACRIKNPKAVRAVGRACGANPVPLIVPCHRVVGTQGGLGGFAGGLVLKRVLLEAEGVSGLKGLTSP